MTSRLLPFLLLVALALTAPAAPSPAAQAAATATLFLPALGCPSGCAELTDDQLRHEAIELINSARVEAGCPAATVDGRLMQAAQDWSAYMALTSDYRHAPPDWYPSYGYPFGGFENIGGAVSAAGIVEGWMISPTHRRNLLWCEEVIVDPDDPGYFPGTTYDIGIGFAEGYWTFSLGIHPPE